VTHTNNVNTKMSEHEFFDDLRTHNSSNCCIIVYSVNTLTHTHTHTHKHTLSLYHIAWTYHYPIHGYQWINEQPTCRVHTHWGSRCSHNNNITSLILSWIQSDSEHSLLRVFLQHTINIIYWITSLSE